MRKTLLWIGLTALSISYIFLFGQFLFIAGLIGGLGSILIIGGIFFPQRKYDNMSEYEEWGLLFVIFAFVQVSMGKLGIFVVISIQWYYAIHWYVGAWVLTDISLEIIWNLIGATIVYSIVLISLIVKQKRIKVLISSINFAKFTSNFKNYTIIYLVGQFFHLFMLFLGFISSWRWWSYVLELAYLVGLCILFTSLIFELFSWIRLVKSTPSLTSTREIRDTLEMGISILIIGTILSFVLVGLILPLFMGLIFPPYDQFISHIKNLQYAVDGIYLVGFLVVGLLLKRNQVYN